MSDSTIGGKVKTVTQSTRAVPVPRTLNLRNKQHYILALGHVDRLH